MATDAELKDQLSQLIRGFWVSKAIYVVAELRLADALAREPKTAEALAEEVHADAGALYRLLRALAGIGIFAEDDQRRFRLTPMAENLRSDHPSGQWASAMFMGREMYAAWGGLLDAVRSGQPGFQTVFGMSMFDYLMRHPERGEIFDRNMTGAHGGETEPMLEAYDFADFRRIVDVGGGNGQLLTAILQRHPKLEGILYDLPGVVERAGDGIDRAGLAGRCRLETGSFFDAVPEGADVYLLRHIIHDWEDRPAADILRNCARAMAPGGRVLVVETVIPPGNAPYFGKWRDLMMFLIGGRERTETEYRRLFQESGLELSRIVPTRAEISIVEGIPG